MNNAVSRASTEQDFLCLAMSNAQRNLSLAFLSLITEDQDSHQTHRDENEPTLEAPGYMNDELAWCWHDGCEGTFFLLSLSCPPGLTLGFRVLADDKVTSEDV